MHPLPRRKGDTPAHRIAAVDRQLATFARLAPGFRALHPIDATSPQECTEITAHVLRSFRFETTHHLPGYRRWLRAADHTPAYIFHRRFLRHLQHNDVERGEDGQRRWVLKCPDHVFTLPALAAAYPDARLIFLHRHPLDVLASVAGLTEALRKPFTRRVDRAAIGRQVTADWLEGAAAMLRARESRQFPEDRVIHLLFENMTRAPLASVLLIYERFGLKLTPAARTAIEARIAALPRGGYAGVTHRLAEYGIDPATARAAFAAYVGTFGIRAG